MRRIKSLSLATHSSKPLFFNLYLRYSFAVESLSLGDDDTLVSRAVQLLRPPETQWDAEQLRDLLFSDPQTPLSPKRLVHIARRLGSSSRALKFFDHVEANSKLPEDSESLSATFQAVFELASREPGRQNRLSELYAVSKERNVSLTANASTLLFECFGRAGMREELLVVFEGLEEPSKNTHVCNKMVNVLLRMRCFEDALQVLDEMLEPSGDSPPNEVTGEIVFPWLLKRDIGFKDEEIVGLVSRFGCHGLSPEPVMLTQLITNFCRDRKVDRAWDVLNGAIESGASIAAPSYNSLLTGLAKGNKFKRMNQLMVKMKERGVKPNVITFGILINYFCKSRRIDEALEIFEKMRGGTTEDGTDLVKPDVITYNTLIDGLCKVGRQDKGLSLMEEMRSDAFCKPNTATYNCLIDGFNKVGEIDKAMELFDRMREDKVPPDAITLNTLVDGLCKNGKVNSAVVLFDEMQRDGVKGNAFTYSILISTFCSVNNINKAMELFDHMLGTGCSGDAVVFHNLIAGLCRAGRMREAGEVVSKLKESGFSVDAVKYNVLISGFCKTKKIDRAYETIEEMEEAGVKPCSVTYNTLIAYLSKAGDLEAAHGALKKMLENRISPTVFTFGALINGFCLNDNIDEAMNLFKSMASMSKVRPNTVIYNILINSLCKKNEVESALSLIDDMRSEGVKPNTTTYNSLFKGLREQNLLDKAFELMDQMVEQACTPDYITVEVLTEWLSAVGKVNELRQFLRGNEVSRSSE